MLDGKGVRSPLGRGAGAVSGAPCALNVWVILALMLLLSGSFPIHAQQQDALTLDDLLKSGQEWLQENVDENWLRALQNVDQAKVQEFLRALQQRFQGDYVLDLASLKTSVKAASKVSCRRPKPAPSMASPPVCRRKRKCTSRRLKLSCAGAKA